MSLIFRVTAAAAILAAITSQAGAQSPIPIINPFSFGISVGVVTPQGDLAGGTSAGFSGVNTGYNVTGSVAFDLPVLPVSLRADAAYNGFGNKGVVFPANISNTGYNADVRVLGFTGNVVLPLPLPSLVVRPYAIGGAGMYDVRFSRTGGGSTSQSNLGFNIGAGVKLPLPGISTFVEARYHRVRQDNGSVSFVPVTVGLMF